MLPLVAGVAASGAVVVVGAAVAVDAAVAVACGMAVFVGAVVGAVVGSVVGALVVAGCTGGAHAAKIEVASVRLPVTPISNFKASCRVNNSFETFTLPGSPANVRKILGRPGEVWGAASGTDKLVVVRVP